MVVILLSSLFTFPAYISANYWGMAFAEESNATQTAPPPEVETTYFEPTETIPTDQLNTTSTELISGTQLN